MKSNPIKETKMGGNNDGRGNTRVTEGGKMRLNNQEGAVREYTCETCF